MTDLNFKGKEFVYNHHLAVPFRPLEAQARKGIGKADLDGNLIIQGDNLHALKALLPMYAGKVDCIFIDPPYNTGNEGWCYSDRVNAPMIREWFSSNPVGVEDGLRHDKWCAMMWPRLRLLHDLLLEGGTLWVTLDDNESHRGKLLLDDIFGKENFIGSIAWKKTSGDNKPSFAFVHDNILVFGKGTNKVDRVKSNLSGYKNPDKDPRGVWKSTDYRSKWSKEERRGLYYGIKHPKSGELIYPDTHSTSKRVWSCNEATHKENEKNNLIWWGVDGKSKEPKKKRFLKEHTGVNTRSVWADAGTNDQASQQLLEVIENANFDNPKPVTLVQKVLEIAAQKEDAVVLDSFAGSGTTAHAVLEANKQDGGNRRFILVEMEDYADKVTAERVRRVIKGYDFKGTQKTELMREKITWSTLKKAEEMTKKVEALEEEHGHEYDKISKTVKDGELIVTGEKAIKDKVEGLGGTFTYCTLGAPLDLDKILTGEDLPDWKSLGKVLFNMATNKAVEVSKMRQKDFYLGEAGGQQLWLIYKKNLDWLKSPHAALTLDRAREFAKADPDGKHLVFAPARYVSQKLLNEEKIPVEFVPLPYSLYRVDGG